jgi:hypothetical protein
MRYIQAQDRGRLRDLQVRILQKLQASQDSEPWHSRSEPQYSLEKKTGWPEGVYFEMSLHLRLLGMYMKH